MKKMNKVQKIGLALAFCAMAGAAHAEGTDATTLITTMQTTVTGLVTALLAAGAVVLVAMLGLKALPWAYSKVCAFFK